MQKFIIVMLNSNVKYRFYNNNSSDINCKDKMIIDQMTKAVFTFYVYKGVSDLLVSGRSEEIRLYDQQ